MGWKLSTLFINSNKKINDIELFRSLGFKNVSPIASKTFEEVMNPEDDELYIGNYNGNTIICIPTLHNTLLDETLQEDEKVLVNTFPNSEISGLLLHSVVNFWGFTLIKNGEKIRVKAGSSEDGTIIDFGKPLAEELEFLNKSIINKDGERVYRLDDYPDEDFTEDQLGENFVFNLSKRYLKESLDSSEELLFETSFKGYSYSETAIDLEQSKNIGKQIRWYKYILYIAIFFILRFVLKYFLN